jgi:hypothetical protein
MTNRYVYTLSEASQALGAKQHAIKMYVKRNNFPHTYDSKGRIVLDLLALMAVYHPRYWYRGKLTEVTFTEARNQLATARREATLKPLAYERDTLSLDALMESGYAT